MYQIDETIHARKLETIPTWEMNSNETKYLQEFVDGVISNYNKLKVQEGENPFLLKAEFKNLKIELTQNRIHLFGYFIHKDISLDYVAIKNTTLDHFIFSAVDEIMRVEREKGSELFEIFSDITIPRFFGCKG